MDKEFHSELDTLFSERHSTILALLKKENQNHKILSDRIKSLKETVRTTANGEIRQAIIELIDLLVLQNHIETKYLYVRGIKDCIDLYFFLSTDFINLDYSDLMLTDESKGDGDT